MSTSVTEPAVEQVKTSPETQEVNHNQPEKDQVLEGQALRDAVLKQIEYYFSGQNLSKDAFLVSQMDHDMFVPIDVVAQFKLVKALTTDVDLILDVMQGSKVVQVDVEQRKIKPNMTVTRNTVILREIPSETKEEEVQKLLDGDECPKPSNIRSEVGDNWFISFDTEDEALDALFFLRQQQFNGKPVKAGMKSENLLRSSYPNGEQAQSFQPFFPSAAPPRWKYGWDMQGFEPFGKRGGGRYRGRGRGPRKDDRKGREYVQGSVHKDKTKGRKKKRERGDKRPVPPNNSSEFPPLPSSRKGNDAVQTGYEEAFIKYSKQEIIDTLSAITEAKRPEGLPEDCLAVAQAPNTELELTKPLPQADGETLTPVVESGLASSAAHKSFAEAVLTAQDIKTPDGTRKRSSKGRRGSVKEGARKDGKRKERHNDNEEHKKKHKQKKNKGKPHGAHKKKQYKPKKDSSEEQQSTPAGDNSADGTSYAAVLKKKEEAAAAAAAAAAAVVATDSAPSQTTPAAASSSPAEDAN